MPDNLRRFNFKFYTENDPQIEAQELINVFHDWIRRHVLPDLLIDVGIYDHVPYGPGVMLVTDEAIYAFDESDGRKGLLYQRRRPIQHDDELEGFRVGIRSCTQACDELEKTPEFRDRLKFDRTEFLFASNDRRIAANDAEGEARFEPRVRSLSEKLYPEGFSHKKAYDDPRDQLAYLVKSATGDVPTF